MNVSGRVFYSCLAKIKNYVESYYRIGHSRSCCRLYRPLYR
jgi:hypothetical protein